MVTAPGTSKVIIGTPTANSIKVKFNFIILKLYRIKIFSFLFFKLLLLLLLFLFQQIHSANSSLAQQTVKGTTTLTKAVGQVKGAISTVNVPPGAQRIILPAGSMGSLASSLVMVPAQYTSQVIHLSRLRFNLGLEISMNLISLILRNFIDATFIFNLR